jgi:hypothetical protein
MVKNRVKESEMSEIKRRARCILEFKLEAVRLVKGGQDQSDSSIQNIAML